MPQMDSKTNLEALPESGNKEFWGEAEINTNLTPQKIHTDGSHYFVRRSGREAQCTHCDWGFVLDPGDKIVDGHLYNFKKELVI